MSATVYVRVWPLRESQGDPSSLLADVVQALPAQDTRLEKLEAGDRPGWQWQIEPLERWSWPEADQAMLFGIARHQIQDMRRVIRQASGQSLYWSVTATRRWAESLSYLPPEAERQLEIEWPDPIFASEAKGARLHRAPVLIDLCTASPDWGDTPSAFNLAYIGRFLQALNDVEWAQHAAVHLDQNLLLPPNCYAVWHRELRDFALDLLWALLAAFDRVLYLDPSLGAQDPAPALVRGIREALAAGQMPTEAAFSRWGLGAVALVSPLFTHEVAMALLDNLDEVVERTLAIDRGDLLRLLTNSSGADFHRTGTGGRLQSVHGIYDCVHGFYLALAREVCKALDRRP